MEINITALLKSKPETIATTKALLTEMALHSKKEDACIQYDLHQSQEKPTHFFFHEIWNGEEALALHNNKPYILKFKEKAGEILAAAPEIYKTIKIA